MKLEVAVEPPGGLARKAWIIKGLPDPRSGTLSDLESEGSGKLVRRVLRRAHAVQR